MPRTTIAQRDFSLPSQGKDTRTCIHCNTHLVLKEPWIPLLNSLKRDALCTRILLPASTTLSTPLTPSLRHALLLLVLLSLLKTYCDEYSESIIVKMRSNRITIVRPSDIRTEVLQVQSLERVKSRALALWEVCVLQMAQDLALRVSTLGVVARLEQLVQPRCHFARLVFRVKQVAVSKIDQKYRFMSKMARSGLKGCLINDNRVFPIETVSMGFLK